MLLGGKQMTKMSIIKQKGKYYLMVPLSWSQMENMEDSIEAWRVLDNKEEKEQHSRD